MTQTMPVRTNDSWDISINRRLNVLIVLYRKYKRMNLRTSNGREEKVEDVVGSVPISRTPIISDTSYPYTFCTHTNLQI